MQNQNPTHLLRHVLILPEDVIEEILLKLAVKSLLRFRSVSRSWLSLINSDRFVKLHLKTSTQNTTLAHHRVVFSNLNGYVVNGCSLPWFLDWNSKQGRSSSSSIIINNPTNTGKILVGCCNGVLCLLSTIHYDDDEISFRLWNPATKVLMELPKLLGNISIKYGFGWDESSGAFKVFAYPSRYNETWRSRSSSRLGHVYSSKTNSWKPVQKGGRLLSCIHIFGLFVGGRLHWVIWHRGDHHQRLLHAIESFNLENDEFGMIDLPPPLKNANAYEGGRPADTWLGEIGGCLFNLFNDYKKKHVDVWVMKEYGVMESWFKLLSFPAASQRAIYGGFPQLGEAPNGDIFIIYGPTFVVCSPKGEDVSSRAIDKITGFHRAGIYVESLVSPITS